MDEFELIDEIVAILGHAAHGPNVVVGPGDDAAVLDIPEGRQLVVSTDALISGRHFLKGAKGDPVGYRSMAVAASDLAAMGARPLCATVALAIERNDAEWIRAFAHGIGTAAKAFRLPIVGGNIAQGPLSITVTVHGHAPAGQSVLRTGGQPGDAIYVTGTLGGAALALSTELLDDYSLRDIEPNSPARRYWQPVPRLELGAGLPGLATAAIDISDGLSSDLAHLCRASGVAAGVDIRRLPLFPQADRFVAATAGDDYELAFTAPQSKRREVADLALRTDVRITQIGHLRPGAPGHINWRADAGAIDVPPGYRHF